MKRMYSQEELVALIEQYASGGLTKVATIENFHAPSSAGTLVWETKSITGLGIDASKPVVIKYSSGDYAFAGYISGSTLNVYVRCGGASSTIFDVYQ